MRRVLEAAAGLLLVDYAAGCGTAQSAASAAEKRSLDAVIQDLSLVLGSEVGVPAFAPHTAFAH